MLDEAAPIKRTGQPASKASEGLYALRLAAAAQKQRQEEAAAAGSPGPAAAGSGWGALGLSSCSNLAALAALGNRGGTAGAVAVGGGGGGGGGVVLALRLLRRLAALESSTAKWTLSGTAAPTPPQKDSKEDGSGKANAKKTKKEGEEEEEKRRRKLSECAWASVAVSAAAAGEDLLLFGDGVVLGKLSTRTRPLQARIPTLLLWARAVSRDASMRRVRAVQAAALSPSSTPQLRSSKACGPPFVVYRGLYLTLLRGGRSVVQHCSSHESRSISH